MAEIKIQEATNVFEVLAGSAAIARGDLLTNDGTDWELADADAVGTYAMAIALASAASGQPVLIATSAVLHDTDDNSFSSTDGDQLYCSGTAGEITSTRPTGAVAIKQVVGKAYDRHGETGATIAVINIKQPYEYSKAFVVTGATSAHAVIDSGNFGGETQDAQNELTTFICQAPENAIAIEIAYIWLAAEATAGTPTFDLTVGSAIDGAQHDAVTADATLTNQAREGAAADEMQRTDITTGLDATDIFRPGALIGGKANQDDSGTDISVMFTGEIVFLCV
jgi:hypothetical protein